MKKLLKSKKGNSYFEPIAVLLVAMMTLSICLNVFQVLTIKTTLDHIADGVLDAAIYCGGFGADFERQVEILKNKYFDFEVTVDADQYLNSALKRVQLGQSLSIRISVNTKLVGLSTIVPLQLTVQRTGQSGKYWK